MTAIRAPRRVRTFTAVLVAVPFVVPFLVLIWTAFRTHEDYIASPGGLPQSFTLDNLIDAWVDAALGQALIASLMTSLTACVVAVTVALAGAFWFHIHDSRSSVFLRWLLVSAWAIPVIAWLIPVFVLLAQGNLTNNRFIVGVLMGVQSVPFALFLIHSFFRQVLPDEVLEAAALDGAGTFRTFGSIAAPLALPALASVAALVFVWSFGDLLIAATLLQDPALYTVPLATASLATKEGIDLQGQAAAAMVALLPTLLLFLFAQRALQRGFADGSGK